MVRWARTRLAADEGFTIIEVLVAAFILVLGALAVFMTFAAAIHNVQRSRETQVGVSVAQREMEHIRVTDFDEVALKEPPARLPEEGAEGRMNAPATQFDVDRGGKGPSYPILGPAQEAGGVIAPVTSDVGSTTGTPMTVYRYVLCEEATILATGCVKKRIVVDVQTTPADNEGNYKHSYYELQSTIVNPEGGA
jgi:type II secretory pathway pseudopilin PulG